MANPIKVVKSAMSAGAKGAKKAAPKVAAEVATGAGGFPAGSWDEILWKIAKEGDKSNEALLAAKTAAGKNPARLRQLQAFGIDVSNVGGRPVNSPYGGFTVKDSKGRSTDYRQGELLFDNTGDPIRKDGPMREAEQFGLFPDRNPRSNTTGVLDEAGKPLQDIIPDDGLKQPALDFKGPSRMGAMMSALRSRPAKIGAGMLAGSAGVYAANRLIPPGAFGKQFEPMAPVASHEPEAEVPMPKPVASHRGPKFGGNTNAALGEFELGGNVDTRSGKGTSSLTQMLPDAEPEPEMPSPSPRSGGMRSRQPSRRGASGLTGVNGVSGLDLSGLFGPSPEWDQTLSSVDDSIQSAQGTLDKFNAPQQEKGGGGFGDLMQKIGPLIAALLMGRMMK